MGSSCKSLSIILMLFLLSYSGYASAGSTTDNLITMISKGAEVWAAFGWLSIMFSRVAGIFLCIVGITKLFAAANGGRGGLNAAAMYIISGALLVAVPSFMGIMTNTFLSEGFHGTNLLSKVDAGNKFAGSAEAVKSVLMFVSLLGHIAFIRGIFIMKGIGSSQNATLGRALTHLVGGALAINIQTTTGIFARTFFSGLNMPLGIMSW